jgi:hypothetical protein
MLTPPQKKNKLVPRNTGKKVTVGWVLRGQAQKDLLRPRLELLYGKEFDPRVSGGDRRMGSLETGKNKLGE